MRGLDFCMHGISFSSTPSVSPISRSPEVYDKTSTPFKFAKKIEKRIRTQIEQGKGRLHVTSIYASGGILVEA